MRNYLIKILTKLLNSLEEKEFPIEREKKNYDDFTLSDFITEMNEMKPYLSCDTVDWALDKIKSKTGMGPTLRVLLLGVYRNSSPMWRDSQQNLREFFGE